MRDLALRLTRGAPGNYEAVAAIERHLLENYRYEQDVPERREPLPAFLFRDRAGYCQQFSGAMALMLRLAGIPSRVVSGFGARTAAGRRGVPRAGHRCPFVGGGLVPAGWMGDGRSDAQRGPRANPKREPERPGRR